MQKFKKIKSNKIKKVLLNHINNLPNSSDFKAIKIYNESKEKIDFKIKLLDNQLQIVEQDNYNAGKVFELNQKYKLQDVNLEKN